MHRRTWLVLFGGSLGQLASLAWCRPSRADEKSADLQETLRSVLKCRRKEEFEFVDLVAQKVAQGALPLALVLNTMKWAVERRRDFPFPYFKEGLKRRAAAAGVTL